MADSLKFLFLAVALFAHGPITTTPMEVTTTKAKAMDAVGEEFLSVLHAADDEVSDKDAAKVADLVAATAAYALMPEALATRFKK